MDEMDREAGELEEDDGRAAFLPAARKGDTVARLCLGQRRGAHEEAHACLQRTIRRHAMRLRGRSGLGTMRAWRNDHGDCSLRAIAGHPTHAVVPAVSAAALGHIRRCRRSEQRSHQGKAQQHRDRDGQETPHRDSENTRKRRTIQLVNGKQRYVAHRAGR